MSGRNARRRRQSTMSPLFTWRTAISTPESGLTSTEHHVGLTLSLHMAEAGDSCFPSIDPTLHEETCGRSAATIRMAINQLVELGWLRKELRIGRGNANEYEALIPSWYENHLTEADLSADVNIRREAALAAASAAYNAPHAARDEAAAPKENRLTQAGLPEGHRSEENHRTPSAKPPDPIKKPTGDRRRERQEGVKESDSSRSKDVNQAIPAAAEAPVTDAEITEAVLSLRDADSGSPKVVIPEAHGLPRSVFADRVDVVRRRRGGVGLLVDLIRIARAERTAALSAQLARDLGANAPEYVPAPWMIDSLKRHQSERYVRIMAATPTFPAELLREALDINELEHPLLELFEDVRRGVEPGDRLGTPTEERRRWVELEAHAHNDDVDRVIDAWDDVDDVERQELHDLAAATRDRDDDKEAAA
jgi:hypothetical protein